MLSLSVVTCNTALDDCPGSVALVLGTYAALLVLTGLFFRAFAPASAGGEQES